MFYTLLQYFFAPVVPLPAVPETSMIALYLPQPAFGIRKAMLQPFNGSIHFPPSVSHLLAGQGVRFGFLEEILRCKFATRKDQLWGRNARLFVRTAKILVRTDQWLARADQRLVGTSQSLVRTDK